MTLRELFCDNDSLRHFSVNYDSSVNAPRENTTYNNMLYSKLHNSVKCLK